MRAVTWLVTFICGVHALWQGIGQVGLQDLVLLVRPSFPRHETTQNLMTNLGLARDVTRQLGHCVSSTPWSLKGRAFRWVPALRIE